MATTYQIIASQTLTSGTSSISFTSIPQTYTDLVIKISARTNEASLSSGIGIVFNDDTSANYPFNRMLGNGSTVAGAESTGNTYAYINFAANGDTSVANSFCNTEIYMPSYSLASTIKPYGVQVALPNNVSTGYAGAQSHLFDVTGAITKITFDVAGNPSAQYVANSSFTLYGIKNS